MTSESRMIEVCEHGMPLGWACSRSPCNARTWGTSPARRADPPLFRRSDFMSCDHEEKMNSLLFSLTDAAAEIVRLRAAVFDEWKAGNMAEDARVRILAPGDHPAPDAYPTTDRWHRTHKPGDPDCPYIVCKCPPADARTALAAALQDHESLNHGPLSCGLSCVEPFLAAMPGWRLVPADAVPDAERLAETRLQVNVALRRKNREIDRLCAALDQIAASAAAEGGRCVVCGSGDPVLIRHREWCAFQIARAALVPVDVDALHADAEKITRLRAALLAVRPWVNASTAPNSVMADLDVALAATTPVRGERNG